MPFVSNTGEPVNQEKWEWIAFYNDGSIFEQFDHANEIYHYFAEIESEKVEKFGLVNRASGKTVALVIPKGAKLIHYYDNIVQHPLGGSQIRHRLFSFGFELGKEKKILTVLPNDFVVETDKIGVL